MRQQRRLIQFSVPCAALTAWLKGEAPFAGFANGNPFPDDMTVVAVLPGMNGGLFGDCVLICESEKFLPVQEGTVAPFKQVLFMPWKSVDGKREVY